MHAFRTIFILSLIFRFPPAQASKEQEPIEIEDYTEIYSHAIDAEPVIRMAWADMSLDGGGGVWEFELTVDESGNVAKAVLKDGLREQRDAAQRAAMALRFKPFDRDGKAVRIRFTYYVYGKAADYVGKPDRSFPDNPPLTKTSIALKRTACLGTCSDYRVEVRGDGYVTYQGNEFVLVKGEHHWRIAPEIARKLIELFRRANYFNLDGYYEIRATDLPTYITRLSIGSQHKFVVDYGGGGMGEAMASTSFGGDIPNMPPIVTEIENAIDELSGVESWVRGDKSTIAKLRAAKWNFRTRQAGNALALLINDCKTELAREFIQQGAPINIRIKDRYVLSAVASAPSCADTGLVRLMESKGAFARQIDAKLFLEASVERGYPDIVAIALEHFSDATIRNVDGAPLINRAASSYERDDAPGGAKYDGAKVVEILLAAGADPNSRDKEGNTPLHAANSEAIARVLINAGADPNARNEDGKTPLFDHYFTDKKKALLDAGADVTLRDKSGQTALFNQRHPESVDVLIHAGADVNAVDLEGRTPIETMDDEKAVLMLLAAGATLPSDTLKMALMKKKSIEKQWTELLQFIDKAALSEKSDIDRTMQPKPKQDGQ